MLAAEKRKDMVQSVAGGSLVMTVRNLGGGAITIIVELKQSKPHKYGR